MLLPFDFQYIDAQLNFCWVDLFMLSFSHLLMPLDFWYGNTQFNFQWVNLSTAIDEQSQITFLSWFKLKQIKERDVILLCEVFFTLLTGHLYLWLKYEKKNVRFDTRSDTWWILTIFLPFSAAPNVCFFKKAIFDNNHFCRSDSVRVTSLLILMVVNWSSFV